MMTMGKTILMVGHGSPIPEANRDFERFVESYRTFVGGQNIQYAYLEWDKPALSDALNEIALTAAEVVVLPLFLLCAGHMKNDIPLMVNAARRRFPKTKFRLAEALGVHPNMVAMISKRVDHAAGQQPRDKTAVVIVGRGSSDPDTISDFRKLGSLFEETSGFRRVSYAYAGVIKPDLNEALESVVSEEVNAIVVFPYLFFSGRLMERLQQVMDRYAKLNPRLNLQLTETLGEDELIFRLLKERMEHARG